MTVRRAGRPRETPRSGPKVAFGQKGWRFVRVWETLMVLVESDHPLTVSEINSRLSDIHEFAEFRGNLKTTRDDLSVLLKCGFPLVQVDKTNEEIDPYEYEQQDNKRGKLKNVRWKLRDALDIGRIMSPMQRRPCAGDLLSLSLMRALLRDTVPGDYKLYQHLRRMLDELQVWLNRRLVESDGSSDQWHGRLLRLGKQYSGEGPSNEMLATVLHAIERRWVMQAVYVNAAGERHEHRLAPRAVWFDEGRTFCLCTNMADSNLLTFRLDRFESLHRAIGHRAPEIDQTAVEEALRHSFRGFSAEPSRIELTVRPEAAYLFREYRFHPSQHMRTKRDGSLRVTLECAVSHAVEEWILGFGELVRVTGPPDLVQRVKNRVAALRDVYFSK